MSEARPIPGLSDGARAVAEPWLDERERERRHLVISLTGAHAYGFPSVDSDLDLKGVHVAPTRALLGLRTPAPSASRMETVAGVELDYTSNEIGQVLAGLLAGSGSYLERILGPHPLRRTAPGAELARLARGALSRRFRKHYAGFSRGQRREYERAEAPTAKKLLYVLRTALTGAHLLATGELVTDLVALAPRYDVDPDGLAALVAHKRRAERIPLDAATAARWAPELDRVQALLDESASRSPLPDEPGNADEMDAWLVALRVAQVEAA